MSDFQFVFLVALLCMVALGLYSHIVRTEKPEASAGMRRIAIYACIALDLGVAWAVSALISHLH